MFKAKFLTLLNEKEALIKRIEKQMQGDKDNGLISDEALESFNKVKMNLVGIRQHLALKTDKGDADSIHLFWRMACNLGAFMAQKPS